MVKKIFVGLLITIVFGAAVFGVASQTFAKGGRSDNGQGTQSETEPGVPNLYLNEYQYEYLYSHQNGDCALEEAVCTREMTATQSQTALQQGPFGGTATQNGSQGEDMGNH
ncbi:MAG: hypothetical protein MUO40_14280, partial [Anaerolineaceae bacterium]|nr:hypothetical protein [Anaerolineaceae bacterium]